MKISHAAIRSVLACGLALLALGASAQTPAGTIKRLQGESLIASARGERKAEVGGTVYAGDRVVTRADSAVGLTLHDGTLLSVGPNAVVTVQNFQFDATTRQGSLLVDVARGALRMVSGLLAREDPRSVAVNTPTATIGIRGTDFVVDVDGPVAR
jgi:hypothetical protein